MHHCAYIASADYMKETRSSDDTFREIFLSAAEGILLVDTHGVIQLANPASEKMFGYAKGELAGMPLEDLLPERYRHLHAQQRQIFHKNPKPRRMGIGRDLVAVRKDGSEFPVEVSLSHHTVKGTMLIMAFVIDITERKS